MHIHKHTVDLTQNTLMFLPALYACCCWTRCNLCSSACAGKQAFLKTSWGGNCWYWCNTWNTRTNQVILSSTKGTTEKSFEFKNQNNNCKVRSHHPVVTPVHLTKPQYVTSTAKADLLQHWTPLPDFCPQIDKNPENSILRTYWYICLQPYATFIARR